MQILALSPDEQYRLLEQGKVGDAVREKLGGDFHRLGELITLSQEEYSAWILTKPLQEDGWVRKSPSTQDGVYFLQRGESWWTVYQQDRGAVLWQESFSTYEEARRYLAINHGIGRFLKSTTSLQADGKQIADGLAEKSKATGATTEVIQGKCLKKWWRFW